MQEEHRHKRRSEDRISSLPDCLLIEILSRLPDTKYAVRTGTLSKTWQHLWTQVSNLTFRHEIIFKRERHESEYDVTQFYSFVEKILTQCSPLNKFKLHAPCTNQSESQFDKCIRSAISHNLQEVDLKLETGYVSGFVLPEPFFINSSFIHLRLSKYLFEQTGVISWKNLRTLRIERVDLMEDMIENILSGSPLLETFELEYCRGFELLDITNKSVKNLVIAGCDGGDCVNINAPYILSLTIKDIISLSELCLLDVSSLIKSELDYFAEDQELRYDKELDEEMLEGLLLDLDHVKAVKIGVLCFELQLSFYLAICVLLVGCLIPVLYQINITYLYE